MSDKKLTVAELLARAGKDEDSGEKPRRRRRSLEEGGISVAELTGSIPTVEAKPAESRHSSVPIDTPSKTESKPKSTAETPAKAEVTPEPKPVVAAKPAPEIKGSPGLKPATKPAPKTVPVAKSEPEVKMTPKEKTTLSKRQSPGADETVTFNKVDADKPEAKEKTKSAETGVMSVVTATSAAGASSAAATTSVTPAQDNPQESPDVSEQTASGDASEETTSMTGVILLAIIGVVLGVVVFKGFELLWESLSRPIVAVLAIVVTAAIVGVVKMLRTSNDVLSMFLAAIVGAVMTFGPLLIIAL